MLPDHYAGVSTGKGSALDDDRKTVFKMYENIMRELPIYYIKSMPSKCIHLPWFSNGSGAYSYTKKILKKG